MLITNTVYVFAEQCDRKHYLCMGLVAIRVFMESFQRQGELPTYFVELLGKAEYRTIRISYNKVQ